MAVDNDILYGDAGNDTLNGWGGVDTLIGGLDNDTYVVDTTDIIIENADEGIDTIESYATFSLFPLPNIENLTLFSGGAINGTGNAANNVIIGTTGNNVLNGGAGADTLTGREGADTHVFQFGQSTIFLTDRITDFAFGSDKIDLLTAGGAATPAPINFSRAANNSSSNLSNLVTRVFTDANGLLLGNQSLGVNSAALVVATNVAIAGTYLVVNDNIAGFQDANDLVINLTGYTGALPALGNIVPGTVFV